MMPQPLSYSGIFSLVLSKDIHVSRRDRNSSKVRDIHLTSLMSDSPTMIRSCSVQEGRIIVLYNGKLSRGVDHV